jgi:hypothetical protein
MPAFSQACAILEAALAGPARRHLAAERSARRLREVMRSHALAPFVAECDRHGRGEGFHALHDWDGVADHVSPESIPVDVLDYAVRVGVEMARGPALAILLDYYFLHVLALLSLRLWDSGDPDANLERLDRLLDLLQGEGGSGHLFVDHAGTLLLLATAHFELEERGYEALLEKVRGLNADHRACIALDHAGTIGCHLRFGFEATYGRDIAVMRRDNVADYPWLSFALDELLEEYSRRPDPRTAEGLLNGLSPDAFAFARRPPFEERFRDVRDDLIAIFEGLRPGAQAYSPLSFFFNFSHNVVKGTVIDALVTGEPWDVTLNDLLTALPPEEAGGPRASLATRLMGYARHQPDRIRGRLAPAIVYDPQAGRQAFGLTLRKVKEICGRGV